MLGSDFLAFCNQEINLHMIFPVIGITARIEIELVTVGSKHLHNDVFHDHSLVNIQLT